MWQAKISANEGVYPQKNSSLNRNYTVIKTYDGLLNRMLIDVFLIWQKIIWQIKRKVAITIYE